MERFLVKYSLWVVIILVHMNAYKCCLERERIGLLDLKAFIKSVAQDPEKILISWVDDRTSNCCGWEGIKCNSTTGHVMELSINRSRQATYRSHSDGFLNAILNVSLFNPFEQLLSLDLSGNGFDGWVGSEGSESFLSLKKLEVLNLDDNHFNYNIFPYLSPITSLKTLILSGNDIEGSLSSQELANLRNLENLDLSANLLNGSLPTQGLCEMKNLVELDLSWNEFSGSPPQCLRNLTYLRVLDLTGNQLSGNVPPAIYNLTSLEYISLSKNNFEGVFSFSSLANLSKLLVFQLASEKNNLQVETENIPWVPTFQLKSLVLSNCNLNTTIPTFLLYQYDLRFIDLSHNHLAGMFPTWLLQNNSKLESIHFMNNSFTGTLQLPTSVQVLLHLEISSNGFSGELPTNIGVILPKLLYMNLSTNSFKGSVPSSIGEMKRLGCLDVSNNNFSGDVPRHLFKDCISLRHLKLSDNSFHGEVIPNHINLTKLWYLHLNNNSFSGKVGNGLLKSTHLKVLDISNNKVSGEIPHWIGSFSNLNILLLSKNLLEGAIPVELCSLRLLYFLDLSQNMLSGSMPSSFNLSLLRSLYLQKNDLSGPIPQVLSRSSYLVTLDLRDNNFSGSIPYWINRLPELRFLLLGGNNLHGHIPNLLCGLRNVRIMDLSRNKLYGSIPSCFTNMSFALAGDDDYDYAIAFSWGTYFFVGDTLPSYYNATLDLSQFTGNYEISNKQQEVEFTMKSRRDSFKGDILNYMAGLDLSCNELTGDIPQQLGDLQEIRALNLSYNSLSGSIPESLSNLTLIESLDLSHNNLSGQIPPQLIELNFLSTFNVSYNNLSGTTPDTGQFGTFVESSYEGNPGLCVSLTKKGCTSLITPPSTSSEAEDDETVIDLIAFYWSFAGSFVTIQLGLLAVLCINPHWRRAWFHFIEVCIYLCFRRPMNSVYLAMKKCIAI